MSKKVTDNNLATDAKTAVKFWEERPDIKLQETTCPEFKKAQNAFQQSADQVVEKEHELAAKLAERDALASEVRLVLTRLRSVVKGFYGPDSKEYELLGGTRLSNRKRPNRRKDGEMPAAGDESGN